MSGAAASPSDPAPPQQDFVASLTRSGHFDEVADAAGRDYNDALFADAKLAADFLGYVLVRGAGLAHGDELELHAYEHRASRTMWTQMPLTEHPEQYEALWRRVAAAVPPATIVCRCCVERFTPTPGRMLTCNWCYDECTNEGCVKPRAAAVPPTDPGRAAAARAEINRLAIQRIADKQP